MVGLVSKIDGDLTNLLLPQHLVLVFVCTLDTSHTEMMTVPSLLLSDLYLIR